MIEWTHSAKNKSHFNWFKLFLFLVRKLRSFATYVHLKYFISRLSGAFICIESSLTSELSTLTYLSLTNLDSHLQAFVSAQGKCSKLLVLVNLELLLPELRIHYNKGQVDFGSYCSVRKTLWLLIKSSILNKLSLP